jgi:hypothetical protein
MSEGKIMNLFAIIIAGTVVGIFMPLFSQLPILNMVNCIPCGWIWIGGVIAVGLYRWIADTDVPLVASDGVIIGLFTGIVAAFTSLVFTILLHGNAPLPTPSTRLIPLLDQVRETFHFTGPRQTTYMFLFLFNLITYPIISVISSFIGVQIFGKSGSRRTVYQDTSRPIHIE